MHERFSAADRDGARASSQRRLARAQQPVERGATERQIGRLLGRNTRAAGALCNSPASTIATSPAGLRLDWSMRAEWDDWARRSEGCYVLRTNITDWTPEELWRTYIQLTEAEAAFRIHKSDLSIRPDLAPARRPRAGPHPGLLPRLRAVEDARAVAEPRRPRQQPAHHPRGTRRINSTDVVLPTAAGRSATSACAASFGPTAPRPLCSIASASACPSGSACPSPDAQM